jgi:deazaflavin-dependent oxidoreductase (nitroreductase family)
VKGENAVRFDRLVGRPAYVIHRWLYRLTGGRIGHKSPQGPMLLLTTTGRKSGQPRTTPLLYMPDGDDCVVVASNGGRPETPQWYLNMRADPMCTLQVGKRTYQARAELLEGSGRDTLWPRLTAFYAGWSHYETLTDRPIPVAVLKPAR